MHLVRMHSRTQRGVDALVPLDEALPLEFGGHDDRFPVSTVAGDLEVFAGKARADEELKIFGSHPRIL